MTPKNEVATVATHRHSARIRPPVSRGGVRTEGVVGRYQPPERTQGRGKCGDAPKGRPDMRPAAVRLFLREMLSLALKDVRRLNHLRREGYLEGSSIHESAIRWIFTDDCGAVTAMVAASECGVDITRVRTAVLQALPCPRCREWIGAGA